MCFVKAGSRYAAPCVTRVENIYNASPTRATIEVLRKFSPEVSRFWSLRHAILDPKTELMNETKTAITPDENPTA